MNYILISDCLWYAGHILTGISTFTRSNFYLTASLVVIGQTITIISRPISRMKICVQKVLENENDSFV